MSQRFIRCRHCGLPHDLTDEACPITGKPIRGRGGPAQATASKEGFRHYVDPGPVADKSPSRTERGPVGRIVGDKYRVLGLVGEGGMGTVYEAEHLEIGRRVAIKVLNRAHLGRKEAVARFHQEARAAGNIGHPNICEIYDVGKLSDGAPYLVMERLNGKTLADRINIEGALPFEDVISILIQVLSALVAAHAKGIIHRDVKPENIFLTERVGCAPVVKILDFGISKSIDQDDLSLTRTGMVMGTPFYMAPEQARGERIDHRVDIYACGVILYETLTGRRPFHASSYNALVIQVLSAQPRDPREIRPAIPASLVPVLYKALAKHREERFDDAKAFIDALSKVESELGRGPSNAEIRKLAEEVRRSTRPPPGFRSGEPPVSESFDIPVDFSETDSGPRSAALAAGEVEVDLSTGPQSAQDDTTLVSDQALFDPDFGTVDPFTKPQTDEREVHDTIVDPSGAMLGELWSQLDKVRAADPTARTERLDADRAEGVLDPLRDTERGSPEPDPGGKDGRYSMVAGLSAEEPPVEKLPRAKASRSRAPRPAASKRPRLPSDPDEDDAVTTLFVSSENGPREVVTKDRDASPKPPRPSRL